MPDSGSADADQFAEIRNKPELSATRFPGAVGGVESTTRARGPLGFGRERAGGDPEMVGCVIHTSPRGASRRIGALGEATPKAAAKAATPSVRKGMLPSEDSGRSYFFNE